MVFGFYSEQVLALMLMHKLFVSTVQQHCYLVHVLHISLIHANHN